MQICYSNHGALYGLDLRRSGVRLGVCRVWLFWSKINEIE
jgi:hypothetical protein